MKRIEGLRELQRLRQGELVVTQMGATATEWLVLTEDDEESFYLKSAMGMVSSFGLGLALTLPTRNVWAFDGDGSFIMNLGSLLTLAENQPPNMKHFVFSNRHYESTGDQPIVNAAQTDYVGLAHAAGIRNAYSFTDIAAFRDGIEDVVRRDAYAMIILETELGGEQQYEQYPADPIEQTYRFGRRIERTHGLSLFKHRP
jgi:thiamine pyrophosphate-dependent acetolactate synthase large subunit-like protein